MRWKTIKHHIQYKISDTGIVSKNGIIMNPSITPDGYLRIELRNPRKKYLIHRLVAESFIKNNDDLLFINHIDEDKKNNHYKNLEWCTQRKNIHHSGSIKVQQIDSHGYEVSVYNSTMEACRKTGISFQNIHAVIRGKRKTAGGFHWVIVRDVLKNRKGMV